MNLKNVFTIAVGFLLCACSSDLTTYSGDNMIQFRSNENEIYSFAYFANDKIADTVTVNIMTIGDVVNYPRKVIFQQVTKEWKYIYSEDDKNKISDSSFVDMENIAKNGVHYEFIDIINNECIIPANMNGSEVKIVVKRDDVALKKNAFKLHLQLLPSEDFGISTPEYALKKISISDKLEQPNRWNTNDFYIDYYIGDWSEVKHRFMIDVTKQKWDDTFINYYIKGREGAPLRNFYLSKINKALEEYKTLNNSPLKDENGKEVTLPQQ